MVTPSVILFNPKLGDGRRYLGVSECNERDWNSNHLSDFFINDPKTLFVSDEGGTVSSEKAEGYFYFNSEIL